MSTLAQGHAYLLCIVPKTLTETRQSKKGDNKDTEMLRATCSADVHRCRPDSNNTKGTRVFAGSRRTTYRDQKNVCSRQKLPPMCNVRHPSQTRETAFNRDEGKHGQREILESRDIRQVPNKRRVEVQSQNRDLLIRDVCTCLAPGCPGGRFFF